VIGQVFGPAGTDAQRRDLMIALLWGTPVALAFGLIAAFATSVGGMLMAALGAWYGGGVDRVVQFLTEVNLILPFFPVSLMVFVLYSKSIITILAVVVALTIFGSALKSYRAVFLQLRTAPYIEAARAYGASDLRIVLRYMVPRIITLLIPRVIILVPGYVFLEATLAFLGVTDPHLPTWGKLVVAALSYGVHSGAAHLVLAPLGVLFLTGFAFAMVGLALERVFEPKLRDA
jgi:peptide/nickel transport system permease protein